MCFVGPREPATAELWLLYFLAQHHDHRGEHSRALEIVDEAMEHTPTLIELYLLKGKIFKVSVIFFFFGACGKLSNIKKVDHEKKNRYV